MEEFYISLLKSSLDEVNKSTALIFVTLIAITISLYQKEDKLKIGNVEIEKRYGGIILYIILCSLNYQLLQQLINIEHVFNIASKSEKVILTIQLHYWIFNPFAKTSGFLGNITDNFGYPILITMWWTGYGLAQKLIQGNRKEMQIVSILFYVIYLILGLCCLLIITSMIATMEAESVKIYTQFLGVFVGLIIFLTIMKKL